MPQSAGVRLFASYAGITQIRFPGPRLCAISAGRTASTPFNSIGIVSHEIKLVKYI